MVTASTNMLVFVYTAVLLEISLWKFLDRLQVGGTSNPEHVLSHPYHHNLSTSNNFCQERCVRNLIAGGRRNC